MKKTLLLLVQPMVMTLAVAQNIEIYNYKYCAQYDARGKKINSNLTGLMVIINYWTDIYGRTIVTFVGTESNTIAGQVMSSMPLCPINQQLSYTGTNNGWWVFNWMNTVLVLISSDTIITRVKHYTNGQ